ncbi:hypothetical protein [Dongia sp.]|uniref:hypothetical protein n=1 Tax=Dongia sp. TaxID=1977262 RepID=UPI0035B3B0FC
MRSLLIVAVAVLLSATACSTSPRQQNKTEAAPNPWTLPQYDEHFLETERAAADFGEQLARACYLEIYRLHPQGLPADSTLDTAIRSCGRAKLFQVIGDPVGEKVCRNKGEFGDLAHCLVMGALINRMRANVGSPTPLTEAEWRDPELAKTNLISELIAQGYAQCTTGDPVAIEKCQFGIINNSLDVAKDGVDYCMTRGNYAASCLVDKGAAKFLRETAMRLWD